MIAEALLKLVQFTSSQLERWVEKGIPPDEVIATHSSAFEVVDRSRPLCPYPQIATYKGEGDTNEAANFVCRDRQ